MYRNPNIRNLFLGRLISSAGDSLYSIAVIWYVFELTQDAFYTGLAVAIVMLPKCFNFLLGPLIEELNKGQVMLSAQIVQFLIMLIIPAAIFWGYESVHLVLTVMFFVSFFENFQGTAEVAIVPRIVPKNQRGPFNSAAGSAQDMADIAMKAVFAGFIIVIGIESVYLFNAATYLAAAFFFSLLKVNPQEKLSGGTSMSWNTYKASLKTGFQFFFTSKIVLVCLPFLIANFAFGMTEAVLPIYADDRGGTGLYGMFILAMTLGSLVGTMLVVKILKYPLGQLMILLPFLSFCLWTTSVFTGHNGISLVFFGLAFIPFGMMRILLITYLQTAIDEELLSRVASIIDSILVSAMPAGALLSGVLTPIAGVKPMMFISCLGLLAIVLYFLLNRTIRALPAIVEAGLQNK